MKVGQGLCARCHLSSVAFRHPTPSAGLCPWRRACPPAIGVVFVMFGQCGFHLGQEPLHLVLQILQKSQVRLFRLQTLLVGRQFLEPHAHVSGMQHAPLQVFNSEGETFAWRCFARARPRTTPAVHATTATAPRHAEPSRIQREVDPASRRGERTCFTFNTSFSRRFHASDLWCMCDSISNCRRGGAWHRAAAACAESSTIRSPSRFP